MIDPVAAHHALQEALRAGSDVENPAIRPLGPARAATDLENVSGTDRGTSFGDLVGGLVKDVDDKGKAAESEVRKLMLGESNNIHRSMIAMQEAGVAFSLLVEVRNKLVESYQELMRMPV